jgi:hypothetical protein
MANIVKVEMEKDDVKNRPDSEKLDTIIDLLFAINEQQSKLTSTIYGNGKPGLCEVVRSQSTRLNWLWAAFAAGATSLGAIIIAHVIK